MKLGNLLHIEIIWWFAATFGKRNQSMIIIIATTHPTIFGRTILGIRNGDARAGHILVVHLKLYKLSFRYAALICFKRLPDSGDLVWCWPSNVGFTLPTYSCFVKQKGCTAILFWLYPFGPKRRHAQSIINTSRCVASGNDGQIKGRCGYWRCKRMTFDRTGWCSEVVSWMFVLCFFQGHFILRRNGFCFWNWCCFPRPVRI